jgi:hypothetical protein
LKFRRKGGFPPEVFPFVRVQVLHPRRPFLEGLSNEKVFRVESLFPILVKFGIIIGPKDSIS